MTFDPSAALAGLKAWLPEAGNYDSLFGISILPRRCEPDDAEVSARVASILKSIGVRCRRKPRARKGRR
jgi:hypothetical protein